MTLRAVIWEPPTHEIATQMPERVRRLLLTLVADQVRILVLRSNS
ncbi:hypothetical protein ACTMTF_12835 [Nonomuraea sp. ZG12]